MGFRILRQALPALCLGFAFLTLGCGPSGPKLYGVSGTVTFQGKELDEGFIQFTPKGTESSFAGAPIKNGKYSVPSSSGLAPGTYVVKVSSTIPTPASTELPGEAPPPQEDKIPPEYNANSTLECVVKAQSGNTFDVKIP